MKCPKCKNDFAKGVKAAYRLGLLDGQQRTQPLFDRLAAANRELYNELTRLDKVQPLPDADFTLRISYKRMKNVIKYLKNRDKNPQHVIRMLNKIIKEQLGGLPKLLEDSHK